MVAPRRDTSTYIRHGSRIRGSILVRAALFFINRRGSASSEAVLHFLERQFLCLPAVSRQEAPAAGDGAGDGFGNRYFGLQ